MKRQSFVGPQAQGSEIDLPFHTLGWYQFEQLALTVIADILGQTVEVYSTSGDAGQDGYFIGNWLRRRRERLTGSTVFQVKFVRDRRGRITAGSFAKEIPKISRLAASGLARNYVLLTNAALSGSSAKSIREALLGAGIATSLLIGKEWLTKQIRNSTRLRSLVPRVYGLGDLSQIVDERAYIQTQTVLKAMSFRMETFVVTKPYRDAVYALNRHRFVLLIGDPMTGKTTISYALALAASDAGATRVIITSSADEFRRHWNPEDPQQLFWVDDVFGQTSYDASRAREWSRALPQMEAALKAGASFIFTTRSYIWEAAKYDLKRMEFPLFDQASVRIKVEELSDDEKRGIMYNHVRLGDQPESFKRELHPHLNQLVGIDPFFPEAARRLGLQFFTKHLPVNEAMLQQFFREPLAILMEIINQLEVPSRALLAHMFAHGGSIALPLDLSAADRTMLEALGTEPSDLPDALQRLNGNLLVSSVDLNGVSRVAYAHPTVRDALAAITAERPGLIDLYLAGVPTEALLEEAACAGSDVQGVKVIIPPRWYGAVAERLVSQQIHYRQHRGGRHAPADPLDFLQRRASPEFLKLIVRRHRVLLEGPDSRWIPLSADDWLELVARLVTLSAEWTSEDQMTVEVLRKKASDHVREYVDEDVTVLLDGKFASLFTSAERAELIDRAREVARDKLWDVLWDVIHVDSGQDVDARFEPAQRHVRDLRRLFKGDLELAESLEKVELRVERSYWNAKADEEEPKAAPVRSLLGAERFREGEHGRRDFFEDVADPN